MSWQSNNDNRNGGHNKLEDGQLAPPTQAPGSRYAPYSRQNLPGSVSADSGHTRDGTNQVSDGPAQGAPEGDNTRELAIREKPQDRPKKKESSRTCQKCGEGLTGQFVRALGGTFHLECFRCRVCLRSSLVLIVLSD